MAGSIQSDINQALGTLGVLAQLSPQLKEHAENMAETRKIKNEEKALKEQGEAMASSKSSIRPEIEEDINNRTRELAKRKFELNPSAETYSEYAKQIPRKLPPEDPEDIHREKMAGVQDEARREAEYNYAYNEAYNQEFSRLDKMSQAMSRVDRQSEAKRTQRNFVRDYLSKMPMLGETVGSIDARNPGFAKKIAAQYSKSQRKTIMDQMDKEGKNGKSN